MNLLAPIRPAVPAPGSISVIILGSRPRLLERLLECLARARADGPEELLVVLNGERAGAPGGLARFGARLPGLRVAALPERSLGAARNAGMALARGEVFCFLDDDVLVPAYYFRTLRAKLAAYPQAAILGGPNLDPADAGDFQRCVGQVLRSRFGALSMRRRYAGFDRDRWTDDQGLILCNLAVRRKALEATGLRFPEDLARNEENLLIAQLLRRGARALHCPELAVEHERRADLAGFWRQCFLSGLGRGAMTRRLPGSLRPVFLLPPLLSLAVGAAPLFPAARLAVAGYGLLAVFVSAWLSRGRPADFLRLCALFPAGHLGYGTGFLAGLLGRSRGIK